METRGRKPIPTELKELRGNPGKRSTKGKVKLDAPALNVIDGEFQPPDPPSSLRPGGEGAKLWDKAWRLARVYLREIDCVVLQLCCEAMDDRELIRSLWQAKQQDDLRDYVDGKRKGDSRPAGWRDRVMLDATDGKISTWLSMLGFSPADRARLAFPEKMIHDSPVEAARKRQAERDAANRKRFGLA